jgi:hypothetical protein
MGYELVPAYIAADPAGQATLAATADTFASVALVTLYDGLHHLNTSHQAQPERVAASLRRLWTRAERTNG